MAKKIIEKSEVLKKDGLIFSYDTSEEKLIENIENIKPVFDIVKIEHRRWCYFMASIGWSYSDRKDEKGNWIKDEILRKNVCMCTYDDLKKKKIDAVKYDLMPLLYMWCKK